MPEKNPTVLLIEDNEDDVYALRRSLKLSHVTNPLAVLSNGQQAIDYLSGEGIYSDRERYPLPFIIFIDLKLPYVDGLEVLAWIKTQPSLNSVAIVILTASTEERHEEKSSALGAGFYMTKPATPESVQQAFEALKSIWTKSRHDSPSNCPPRPQSEA